MKIAFISNFLNHHQLPVCLEFVKQTDGQFNFIATSPINAERLSLGYVDMNKQYPWVVCAYDSDLECERAKKIIDDADVVISGSAPDYFIKNRLKQKKLTFRYSERIYKRKPKWYEMPVRYIQHFIRHKRHKNLYMLCASSYAAQDYSKTGAFINKCFKWGYFPEIKKHNDLMALLDKKINNSIIWVARFIDWKHPEMAISLAEKLVKEGYDFQIKMIGNGSLLNKVKNTVVEKGLQNRIDIMGSMSPDKVREQMENSQIHIFTSDRNEGWGAVLNEAMNSACACVCSNEVGSARFLIDDNTNGVLFNFRDINDLVEKVKLLLDNRDLRVNLSINAYKTMINEWNAENAVKKFLITCEHYFSKNKLNFLFNSGVLSKAE